MRTAFSFNAVVYKKAAPNTLELRMTVAMDDHYSVLVWTADDRVSTGRGELTGDFHLQDVWSYMKIPKK